VDLSSDNIVKNRLKPLSYPAEVLVPFVSYCLCLSKGCTSVVYVYLKIVLLLFMFICRLCCWLFFYLRVVLLLFMFI